ncbi:AI-2E family transporter [Cyanobium sp. Morenito 9A2]|nr:AI-2E family transporter [Cyanobium sp. Morenito 9A2]
MVRYLLIVASAAVTVVLFNYFAGTIGLFTAAGIVAALLNIPLAWLERRIPRPLAITVVALGALVLATAFIALVGLQVLNQGQSLVFDLRNTLKTQDLSPLHRYLEGYGLDKITQLLQAGLVTGLGVLQTLFTSAFTGIFGAVISLYLLIDGEQLWRGFLGWLPDAHRDRFERTFKQSFLGFINGQLLLMLFLTLSTAVVFPLVGVKYALLLAVIVGVLDAIPGIGATLGIVLVTALVFASQGGDIAMRALIASLVLGQIQDNVVHPRVMGKAMELNPVVLFLALFIGQRTAGLLGVFLSIPIAGMVAIWLQSLRLEAAGALSQPAPIPPAAAPPAQP